MIQSIIANDLTAEFPFDLSSDEARIVSHFQTASLILGRSGTGKTTCLVFKLVGKYLASKAIAGERPVRQVSQEFRGKEICMLIDSSTTASANSFSVPCGEAARLHEKPDRNTCSKIR